MLQVDIGLEGAEIGERLRIAEIILVGEGPGIEQLGLLLCHLRQQRDRLGVVRRIEQVLQRVQIVLHEIDHRIAMCLEERLAGDAHDHLAAPDRIELREQRMRKGEQFGIGAERQGRGDEVDLALLQHGFLVGKAHFDHRDVALVLQIVFRQHRAHRHVDRAAALVGRDDLALEILDRMDRAVLAHKIAVRVVARDAVLKAVANDAQILHPGIDDPEREGRIGQCRGVELAGRERLHRGRGALEMGQLRDVGLAGMGRELGSGEHQCREIRPRHHPADAQLVRLGRIRR